MKLDHPMASFDASNELPARSLMSARHYRELIGLFYIAAFFTKYSRWRQADCLILLTGPSGRASRPIH